MFHIGEFPVKPGLLSKLLQVNEDEQTTSPSKGGRGHQNHQHLVPMPHLPPDVLDKILSFLSVAECVNIAVGTYVELTKAKV